MKKTKYRRLAAMAASLLCCLIFTIPAYAQSSEPQPETAPAPAETEAEPETQNLSLIHILYRDGVCRVADRYYTKTIEYEDINYQLAQSEDQAAIFDGWSACLNYFDSSLPFQLSFLNHRSRPGSRYSVNIPMQDDDYNSVRCEYVKLLGTVSYTHLDVYKRQGDGVRPSVRTLAPVLPDPAYHDCLKHRDFRHRIWPYD